MLLANGVFSQQNQQTKPGIDVLIKENFEPLKGKRVALLTNTAGKTSAGTLTLDEFLKTNICQLNCLLTPEHGFYTTVLAGKHVSDDTIKGIPAISLYGKNRRPSRKHLENCDAVVVDIQDIGIRSYTFISTVYKVMDACAEYGKEVIILDRPNPIGGLIVDGNTVEKGRESFVSQIPVSYVHGCTVGELAVMTNEEGWLSKDKNGKPRKCKLKVIKMENWKRAMRWEDTGLNWQATSPNIPNPDAVRGAAMFGTFGEFGRFYLGIGTPDAFQCLGMPQKKIDAMRKILKSFSWAGFELMPTNLEPLSGRYSGYNFNGFKFVFIANNDFLPYTTGIKIMLAIRKIEQENFTKKSINPTARQMFEKVTGSEELLDAILFRDDEAVLKAAGKGLEEFKMLRDKYLMYE